MQRITLIRALLRWVVRLALLGLLLSSVIVGILRFIDPPTSAFMIERWVAAKWQGEHLNLRYRWADWSEVSSHLPIALIAAEDQKFPQHHGFDVIAIQQAIAEAEEGDFLRGASTISQQVAKNLFLWGGHSFIRKGLEAYFTVLIEIMWPKQRILEVYFNIAEFGDGIYGVTAASEQFFGIPATQINEQQAALLAAVLPNPHRYHVYRPSPYVMRRARWIQQQVRHLGGSSYMVGIQSD